jgi:NAD(P)-dependent dehydrogenase (short-subunit alcohol dehydrogenase family)
MQLQTADRSVLVTGATGGIGTEVVHRLRGAGYFPIVTCREGQRDAGSALAASANGALVILDLTSADSISAALARLTVSGAPLHAVIHCASPKPVLARLGKITETDMIAFWRANVEGPRLLLAGLVKHCFHRTHGALVVALLTAAMGRNGRGATAGMGAYTISKYGLQGVLALLAAEVPWIRVETIMPGFVDTAMLAAFDPRFIEGFREKGMVASVDSVADEIMKRLAGAQGNSVPRRTAG